ncbi:hypothetical protein TanjilG_29403 [Lupinus angustifolius]|uniref:Uncharacterized protein n=1 Tax=Lupinus angustifolius TaxID=3871 RepID=A0A1J7H9H0_LUPAN|nr:hypothetical protein TanjilG_29403 [Lupinus angustifolius]
MRIFLLCHKRETHKTEGVEFKDLSEINSIDLLGSMALSNMEINKRRALVANCGHYQGNKEKVMIQNVKIRVVIGRRC